MAEDSRTYRRWWENLTRLRAFLLSHNRRRGSFFFPPAADQLGRDGQTEGSDAGLQDSSAGYRGTGKPGDEAAPLAEALQGERQFI